MNIVRVGDFTVSHSSDEDYRAVSSLSTDFRPLSLLLRFENHERMTSRVDGRREREGAIFFVCNTRACVWSDFFLIISLCDSDDRSSPAGRWKKYCRPDVSLTRRLCGAASRSRLSRCALSRVVCYWPFFAITQVSWEGQLGQVDTPNPRTVRNRGWRLTGVCARKAISFLLISTPRFTFSLNLQIIRVDIFKRYTIIWHCDIKYALSAMQLLQLSNLEFV